MKRKTYDNQIIIRYLVGSLPPDETERLDELSFTDDEFAERLQSVEDDLVDEYVRGELQGDLLERFKSSYLASPTRREKVEFAESFLGMVDDGAGAEPRKQVEQTRGYSSFWSKGTLALPKPAFWLALAAAAILLIASGSLLVRDLRLSQLQDQARSENEILGRRAEELQAQLGEKQTALSEKQREIDQLLGLAGRPGQSAAPDEPNVVPVILEPQTRAIGLVKTVAIPAEADFVTFQLGLEADDLPDYRATLKSLPGQQTIWSRGGIKSQRRDGAKVLAVTLRTRLMNSQNYILELADPSAGTTLTSYTFRIVRE